MDPALLKEREAFLKRARAQPTVEKRKAKPTGDENASKKAKISKPPQPKAAKQIDYKTAQGSSTYRFSVLARIVKHMKLRHQDGDTEALLLDEILDETNQLDITVSIRHWLATEALANNPKMVVKDSSEGRKFAFKPKLDIRDKRGLMKLLKNYDLIGKGGVLMEDVEESLPNAPKAVKQLEDHLIIVSRPVDKKKVLFYRDKTLNFGVDDDYKKMWRSVAVEGLDEAKIEEYLTRSGITSMQDAGIRRVSANPRRKKGGKKNQRFKRHNDHLEDVLKDYSEMTNKT
ncbi:transcription initiation factor IIE subunit beta-like [Littorina saxatilis]|uniref:Transcription initiation factor IIE subunit beta n=1 Tax=Littorina saxatilis TaxID=31220 RepID=A0AAN9G097_9CAEN